MGNNIMLLTKAFKKKFIIPNFSEFAHHIDGMYDVALRHEAGQVGGAGACRPVAPPTHSLTPPTVALPQVADYIPQLAKFSPDLWGVSLCTIDGQRYADSSARIQVTGPGCHLNCSLEPRASGSGLTV